MSLSLTVACRSLQRLLSVFGKRISQNKILFVLVLLWFLSRGLVVVASFHSHQTPISVEDGDENRYYPVALSLSQGNGFSVAGHPNTYEQPGYVLLLAAVCRFTTHVRGVMSIVQVMLEGATLLIIWKITNLLSLGRRVSLIAVAFTVAAPFLPNYCYMLYTEVVATFLVTLFLFLVLKAVKGNTYSKWIFVGLAGGSLLLIRPEGVLIIGFVLATATAFDFFRLRSLRILRGASIAALVTCITLVPWTIRNYGVTGKVTPFGGVTDQTQIGYVHWLNTWVDHPVLMVRQWWFINDTPNAPSIMPAFPENKIPEPERAAAWNAYLKARATGGIRTQNGTFEELAKQARKSRFWRARFIIPVTRMFRMWEYLPFFAFHWGLRNYAILFWIPFSFAFVVGTLCRIWFRDGLFLLGACLAGRLVLPLIAFQGLDPRYLIMALPSCFILAAMAFAAPAKAETEAN